MAIENTDKILKAFYFFKFRFSSASVFPGVFLDNLQQTVKYVLYFISPYIYIVTYTVAGRKVSFR